MRLPPLGVINQKYFALPHFYALQYNTRSSFYQFMGQEMFLVGRNSIAGQ